jgi:uncharacterized glyoxalase superfamily protein PhnB
MDGSGRVEGSTIIPTLRYRDAPAAIEWLCGVFGFQEHIVVPNDDGTIAHAQLRLGTGMVMLSSAVDTEFGHLIKQPDQVDGTETQSPYIVVADADGIYERVIAEGGRIVIDIKDEDYGGRGFSCLDPEGHLWNIGTYNPW